MSSRVVRVGINGFGRMGRLVLRAAWNFPGLEIVHINEIKGGVEAASLLVKFDSVQGQWPVEVTHKKDSLVVEGKSILFTEVAKPEDIPWETRGVDIVLECTGKFLTKETLQPHFKRGVKKIIVSAPVKQDALNVVVGVNDDQYRPEEHNILTAASCTTNCLAPIVKVIKENIGIVHGMITTVHNVTNTQTVVDAPHKDLRRARSCLTSLVPTTTGSATAIALIYPELKGKLNGHAIRVPLLNSSITDVVFEVSRPTTVEEVNALLKAASESGPLKGILGYEERPLVSIDYKGDPRSSIVDAPMTLVTDKTQVKILSWYDNEWGYVNRMAELAQKIAKSL